MSEFTPITKPFLPPLEEYNNFVKRAYNNEWLTNRGELVVELELKLQEYLHTEQKPIAMANGTIPLQIALKVLGDKGEVITTPFSYIATTSSIIWEDCTPVFVDIDPVNWTIDETKIEAAITDKTTCILATHVFGNACNVVEIERIAKKYNLYVIYDAAHCFGVQYKNKSIFDYGDISTCSFHATKIFHTGEGGAVFVNNESLFEKIYYSHNFGHNGPIAFHGLGINGKMSELQAAMGLAVLPYMDQVIEEKKNNFNNYSNLIGDSVTLISLREYLTWNYSYTQAMFNDEEVITRIISKLSSENVILRRYFFPSLHEIPYIQENYKYELINSEKISRRIITLPNFHGIGESKISEICSLILKEIS